MGRLILRSSGGGPPADTTPDAFSFTDQTGVATSSTITSAAITVSGINTASAISVTGGSYDINSSGSFTSSPGFVSNTNTVRARHTSSASNSTNTDTVVTIGGVSDTFTSTTVAAAGGFNFDSGWSGSGTFADGQFVTITRAAGIAGTVRTDERPRKWIPGTAISGDTTYSRDSTTLTLQNNAAVGQSSIIPYSGHPGTLDQTFPITPTDACFIAADPVTSIGSAGMAYMSWYVRFGYSHTSDGSNNKMARIWNTANTSSMYAPNHFVQTLSEDGANTAGGFFYDINDSSNTWYLYEYEFRENSAADVHDGLWQFAMNAGLASADSTLWTTRESGFASDSLHHRVFGPQQSNQPPPANGSHLYMADWYVSDTLLRCFISTESTYTTSVYAGTAPLSIERQVQLMRATGNNSTTLSLALRAGKHSGALAGKYLWVVASDRTRYRVGQFT